METIPICQWHPSREKFFLFFSFFPILKSGNWPMLHQKLLWFFHGSKHEKSIIRSRTPRPRFSRKKQNMEAIYGGPKKGYYEGCFGQNERHFSVSKMQQKLLKKVPLFLQLFTIRMINAHKMRFLRFSIVTDLWWGNIGRQQTGNIWKQKSAEKCRLFLVVHEHTIIASCPKMVHTLFLLLSVW